ncbi:Wzz/FepE/Etk N-terminal domain-containing protein [Desulfoscipio sp. XC116]|uniref:GumC family protein n=1 Tax=Desulfoscipio sp. XC116 TaxID=3144975 RepID=UPI00325BBC64
MSEKPDYVESDVIDLRQIFEVLKKWRRIIIIITILAVFMSGIMSYLVIDPVYEAKSMLLVTMPAANQQSAALQNGDDLESVINTMSRLPFMTMNTYVSQLTSDTIYQRVVDQLKLDEQGYTAKNLAGMVKAEVAKDSNIIELKVQHTDPRLAADVANVLGEAYLAYLSERNQKQMTRSTDFLQEQKKETDEKLNKLLEDYRIFNSDVQSVDYLQKQFASVTDDLNKYQTSVDTAYTEVRQLEAGVASLKAKLAGTPETVTATKAGQDGMEAFASEEMNPVYISLSEKLNEKEAELAEKTAGLAAMNSTIDRLRSNLASLQTALSSKQIKRQQMDNEIARLEETQNMLAQKITQTQIARSIDMGETSINVASPALVPAKPVKPNKQLNMAVALVLGLMVAVGLAFVLEFMDNTIKGPDDVQKHLGLVVIGTIPVYKSSGGKSGRGFLNVRKA